VCVSVLAPKEKE